MDAIKQGMRILIHDFSGHPFQVELSRELARRGHAVYHSFSSAYVSGKGDFSLGDRDGKLVFTAVEGKGVAQKRSITRRTFGEVVYALRLRRLALEVRPHVIILCNIPLIAHAVTASIIRTPQIFWHQDIYSAAMGNELRRRRVPANAILSWLLTCLERRVAKRSQHVVAISEAFLPWHVAAGTRHKTSIVENWAPLSCPHSGSGEWLQQLAPKIVRPRLVYAGTLGLKHNPKLLHDLIVAVRQRGFSAAELLVVSEGTAADSLRGLEKDGLKVLPFAPVEDLPSVLGSADALVIILEQDASSLSVPSKTLTYFVHGRPVVGLLPDSNPAAIAVRSAGGITAEPTKEGVQAAAEALSVLLGDEKAFESSCYQARRFAEKNFLIEEKANAFEALLLRVSDSRPNPIDPADRDRKSGVLKRLSNCGSRFKKHDSEWSPATRG